MKVRKVHQVPFSRGRALVLVLISNVGILGLTFLTGMLNARLLGPAGRGELAAIQTVAASFGAVALLGLPTAVGFFSAKMPRDVRSITLTTLGLCFAGCVPFIALAYALMPTILGSQSDSVVQTSRIFLVFLILQPAVIVLMTSLQGLGRFKVWSFLRPAPYLATLLAIGLAWATGAPTAESVARYYLLTYALIIPVAFVALWLNSDGPAVFKKGLVRQLVGYGLPSAMMVPVGVVNLQLDQLLMAAWLPSQLLGLYAVSVSWSGLVSPILSALGSILFPTLAATEDLNAKRLLVSRSLRCAVLVAVICSTGLGIVTPLMIPVFFGSDFRPAVPVALILLGASLVLNLGGLCGEMLRGLGHPRWPLYGQLAGLPVTVGLLVLLLPTMSIVGAGLASLSAYLTSFLVCLLGLRRSCGISLAEMLLPRREDIVYLGKRLEAMLIRPSDTAGRAA